MKEIWYIYAPQAMARHRRIATARTLALFVLTIAAGVTVDRLPSYRAAIARFEMGEAFLYTLPAIVLALVTYVSGWEMRRQQSESLARYQPTADALLREGRGEEPERIPWDRIDHLGRRALLTRGGASLPFYAHLIENGAALLAVLHREVARRSAPDAPAPRLSLTSADVAPRPDGTPPPWPGRLPRPAPRDHAAWAAFYEEAVRAQESAAAGR